MSENFKPSVGDIIIKSFITTEGKKVSKHSFVIVAVKEDLVTALDERAIFAGYAVSDYSSPLSKNLLEDLKEFDILKNFKINLFKKESVAQVESLIITEEDIVAEDKHGEVNPVIIKKALGLLERLDEVGKLRVEKNNLPKVVFE